MSDRHCKDCSYYLQHYTFDKEKIFRVFCGHCTLARARRKRPDTPACERYAPGQPDAEAFATKEYLSKELLNYVLNLELLPEIEERLSQRAGSGKGKG